LFIGFLALPTRDGSRAPPGTPFLQGKNTSHPTVQQVLVGEKMIAHRVILELGVFVRRKSPLAKDTAGRLEVGLLKPQRYYD
jgi:hypothetical protein